MYITFHRKRLVRKRFNSRGLSSIVGAIFMMLIVWSLASAYFFFTLSQNTIYVDAVRQKNQTELDRMSESVQALNTSYVVSSNGIVRISARLQNVGSFSVRLITLWLYVSNDTNNWNNYNFSKVEITLQGGETLTQDFNVSVAGVSTTGAYSFASWFITGRGNTVALKQANTQNIVVSQTTNGIGALMMSFQDFYYYTVQGSGPYSINLAAASSGYTVTTGTSTPIAFKVILTNLDYQMQNDITLYSGSVFFSIFPETAQQVRASYWYIVNVNEGTGAISSTYTNIVLRYNVPTAVYFASGRAIKTGLPFTSSSPGYTGTSPINLALIGTRGSQPLGQNIPFVSISVS